MEILEIKDLSKYYGKKQVLKDISFSAHIGELIGLYGPNGSGKTTLLKLIVGLLRPSKGSILIDEKEPGSYTKSIVSFLPDKNIFPSWMSVKDALNFYLDFYRDFDSDKFMELLMFFNLKEDYKVKELSKGDLEKLILSLVISRKAKIYLLDEPLGGIDPSTRDKIIYSLLKNYCEESLMIISTHLVKEIENITDRTLFISQGEIIMDEKTDKLREERNKSIDTLFRETFQ
ncbi:MAG TPA: ABC transporter ATP-binding protein [Dictyoglomaceae bacterium]|nr:ABC transporter ATP-binding protein [Dictyoglomaceae bacterium]HOL39940.1 ABC transporter ATP-binding protein [Dictyoglomaceae bacterium]HOP95671.1 ABC transporter ATP-binding protein [Dictyoglomaceae bacterium]HPP16402.1 ABC transporter ATP-binding protein [Dictyoglomaceae bacterium]HPU43631.1 ABC transporter ATP-binding protein [Dictyoglomaceae bacterium]